MQGKSQTKRGGVDVLELLRQVPVLQGLEDESLDALRSEAVEETYQPGQMIIREGSLLSDLYVILRGQVEVRKRGAVIASLGKGQFFGEMAFLNEDPTGRSADIVALDEAECLSIKGPLWYAFLRKNPDVAIEVIRTLASRLRNADWALRELQNLPPAAKR